MAMAPTIKVVLGSISFGVFWILAVFPAVPFLPIGRTAGSLLGSLLMIIFRVISPDEAYASIDLQILGLLFGTMVVSIYLERADMFKYLGKLLSWKSRGGKDLLCRVCLISALASALFTNDTSCVVLTEFILKIAKMNNLPPQPFLLALASSANIGSAATPIGNPQNLVIAVQSGILFGKFLVGILPAMLIGMLVNTTILLCYFWKVLSVDKDIEKAAAERELVGDADVSSHRFSPATMSHLGPLNSEELGYDTEGVSQSVGEDESRTATGGVSTRGISRSHGNQLSCSGKEVSCHSPDEKDVERWKGLLWKIFVYLVTSGMLVSLLMGLDMSWTAITAALALMVIDFKDAQPCLEKVSYSLLIFFCGMFITVDGFNKTGIPSALWDFVEPHAQIDSAGGVALLTLVILFLSNIASNVPTVLLLGARVAASATAISSAKGTRAWLIMAWVSTVAGNLSLFGSAANLIVCEQARRAQCLEYNLSFWSHLRFGVPSTLIVSAIGLLLITAY